MELLQGHKTLDEKVILKIVSKIDEHKIIMDKFLAEFLLAEGLK